MRVSLKKDPSLVVQPGTPIFGTATTCPIGHGIAGLLARVQQEFDSAVVRVACISEGRSSLHGFAALAENLRHAVHKPRVWIDVDMCSKGEALREFFRGNDANLFLHDTQPAAVLRQAIAVASACGRPIAFRAQAFWSEQFDGITPDLFVENVLLRDVLCRPTLHRPLTARRSATNGLPGFVHFRRLLRRTAART